MDTILVAQVYSLFELFVSSNFNNLRRYVLVRDVSGRSGICAHFKNYLNDKFNSEKILKIIAYLGQDTLR